MQNHTVYLMTNFNMWIIGILFLTFIFAILWRYIRNKPSYYWITKRRTLSGKISKGEYEEAKKVVREYFQKMYAGNNG